MLSLDMAAVDRINEVRSAAKKAKESSFTITEIKQAISGGLVFGKHTQKDTARRLGVSVRTLQRRLEEKGTSYGDVLDAIRLDRLEQLIRGGDSLSEAARKLHFKSRCSLNKLLERRRSMRPSEYKSIQSSCLPSLAR